MARLTSGVIRRKKIMFRNLYKILNQNCLQKNKYLLQSARSNYTNKNTKFQPDKLKKMATDIVWMDLEMTGLDVHSDKILEISCLITDKDLNLRNDGLCLAINHPAGVLQSMNEWCMKTHYESGLVQKCHESKITPEKAEAIVLDYLQENIPRGKCPLAGNSIYMDRLFLRQQMKSIDDYLHYRIIDVSTIKELSRRWNPKVMDDAPPKKLAHRSLDDIKESLEELKYYRQNFFKTM